MARFFIIICVCFCFAQSAPAWNAMGHMLVSQIAYNHLAPAAKAKCDALIAVSLTYASNSTSNFVTAAVWADDFRNQLGTGTSHYIDLPFSLDGTLINFTPPTPDVVQAINECIATLQNPVTALTNQAICLRYLLHYVGDIHQPLHCSTAISSSSPSGDAGGNGFSLSASSDWSNLHSLWDAGGGYLTNSVSRPLTAGGQATLNSKILAAETLHPYVANTGTIPNPMSWAQEGLGRATNVTYVGITRGSTPSANYLNTVKATAEERVAAGGHRLADLLNTLFAPAPVSLTPLKIANGKFGFSWQAISNATYRVQWKAQLNDPVWNDRTNLISSSNSASFSEVLSQTQRVYRVVQ